MSPAIRKHILPFGLLFLLLGWQATFLASRHALNSDYRTDKIVGLHDEVFKNFLYFFYYFGVFPVGSPILDRTYSASGAQAFVREHGASLVMDLGTGAGKMGDYGKIFLYLPDTWIQGSPEKALVKTSSAILFVAALASLFLSFWFQGYPVLGTLLVLFVGSDPFQLMQAYQSNNVFSITISIALILLALNLRFLLPNVQPERWHYVVAVISGILPTLAKSIRVEAGFILYSVMVLYGTLRGCPWRHRLALLAAVFFSAVGTTFVYQGVFDRLYENSLRFVEAHGGTAYKGPRRHHHVVWHTLATGLGDFGQKHGYAWDDLQIYAYGVPIVIEKFYPSYIWKPGHYFFENTHDPMGKYLIQPEDLPEYEQIIRDKILGDIAQDPGWYLGVLARRSWRILTELTPVSLAISRWRVGIPVHGLLVLLLIGWLVRKKEFFYVRLILFTLPLSLGPLLHYSGGGQTYYAIFHVVAFAVAATLLLKRAPQVKLKATI